VVDPTPSSSHAWIGPLCVVERGARIGAGTVLKSRVTVGEDCVVGARCIVHAGVVIGADGFGFAPDKAPGKRSSSWAPCASATTWKSVPTPALTVVRCKTR
jgi:hypothetical protein